MWDLLSNVVKLKWEIYWWMYGNGQMKSLLMNGGSSIMYFYKLPTYLNWIKRNYNTKKRNEKINFASILVN